MRNWPWMNFWTYASKQTVDDIGEELGDDFPMWLKGLDSDVQLEVMVHAPRMIQQTLFKHSFFNPVVAEALGIEAPVKRIENGIKYIDNRTKR
jgi:hypothetical protein